MRLPAFPSLLALFSGALALSWAASARADEPPPVALPPPGDPPAAPASAPGDLRRAPSDEVSFAPTLYARDAFPLAGFHHDHFYLRDPEDRLRLFPGGMLQLDSRGALGRGVSELAGPEGEALRPRMAVRRARLDLGGQIHRSWSFLLSGEFASPGPRVEYALVDLEFHRLFHLTLGQQLLPVTMANRTFEAFQPWLERPLVVRFALPRDKDLGLLAWGATARNVLGYEAGVFGGDAGRPNADNRVDAAGRVYLRPLAASDTIARDIQIGASGAYGVRQIENVSDRLDPLSTDGGFVFWDTSRAAADRRVLVVPSGDQVTLGGEVRVPVSQLDFRFEFLYSKRNTRERLDGGPPAQSERFGTLSGTGFYAHLGVWILGQPEILGPPGRFRPPRVRFPRGERPRPERGLAFVLRFDSLDASYDPAGRASAPGDASPRRDIKARSVGGGLNYYAGRHAAFLLHYTYNFFPDSSVPVLDPSNAAVAPGNLSGHSGAHQLHEIGARMQVFF